MDKPIFKLVILPEADAFLESLAPAVLRKVFYNIDKVAGGSKMQTCSRSLAILIFGSSAHLGRGWHTDCLPFGTKTVKHSLSLPTDL